MHFYSSSFSILKFVHFFLAVVSLSISYFLSSNKILYLGDFQPHITPFLIFGLFELFFNKVAWKWFAYFPQSGIFNFNGKWIGSVSHDDNTSFPAEIDVQQTFYHIFIEFRSGDKRGHSFCASIERVPPVDFAAELRYSYFFYDADVPNGREGGKEGRSNLFLSADQKILKGYYFTSQGRKGKLELKRKS